MALNPNTQTKLTEKITHAASVWNTTKNPASTATQAAYAANKLSVLAADISVLATIAAEELRADADADVGA